MGGGARWRHCLQYVPADLREGPAARPAWAEDELLTNVYTVPELRGSGIGADLLRRVIASAEEHGCKMVVVWPSHESVAFYRRLGFTADDEMLALEFGG